MRVHVGGDHAAYDLLVDLVAFLAGNGHEVTNHGPHAYDAVDDYPVFVLRAAEAVAADPGSFGVVLGGSGNGEQMAANKVAGIRAALCYDDSCPARSRAQRRPGHLDRRPDGHRRAGPVDGRGLRRHRVQRRPAAPPPHRHGVVLPVRRHPAAAPGLTADDTRSLRAVPRAVGLMTCASSGRGTP